MAPQCSLLLSYRGAMGLLQKSLHHPRGRTKPKPRRRKPNMKNPRPTQIMSLWRLAAGMMKRTMRMTRAMTWKGCKGSCNWMGMGSPKNVLPAARPVVLGNVLRHPRRTKGTPRTFKCVVWFNFFGDVSSPNTGHIVKHIVGVLLPAGTAEFGTRAFCIGN